MDILHRLQHVHFHCFIVLIRSFPMYSGWDQSLFLPFSCLFFSSCCIICITWPSLIFLCLRIIITHRRRLVPVTISWQQWPFLLFSMLMSLSYRQSHVGLVRLLCISLLEASLPFWKFRAKRWIIDLSSIHHYLQLLWTWIACGPEVLCVWWSWNGEHSQDSVVLILHSFFQIFCW